MAPLGGDVPRALPQRRTLDRGVLGGVDVDPRRREVADAAGVVQVEMGEHDVGDVGRVEAERPDLLRRRLGPVEDRPDGGQERSAQAAAVGEVAAAEAGVDQRQAAGPLEEEDVGDHRR